MSRATNRFIVRCRQLHPIKLLLLGYASYVVIGWLLLSIPATQAEPVDALDNLFIATSAMSTTGLVSVNQPVVYTFWGELVILVLIQLGGIGFMTFGSFIVLAGRQRMSQWREKVVRSAFVLPEGFRPARFIRNVVVFTLTVEAVGAALLFWAFSNAGVAERAAAGEIGASGSSSLHIAWQAIFHSVSAFCTAGFSLFPDSLEAYHDNVAINAIISGLAICGAIGFIVLSDFTGNLLGRKPHLALTSKIILIITAWFIVGGAVLLFLGDPAVKQYPAEQRILVAWFQSMTSATTVGFNTMPIGTLGQASVLLMYLLMVIGASPSGTGGGLKSTSVSALIATVRSTLRGQEEITFFGKVIPRDRLHTAYSALGFYVFILLLGGYLLLLTETRPGVVAGLANGGWPFEDLIFEAASALGTVGLSRGVTGDLSSLGKLVIIVMMFIGRLGPLSFGLALFQSADFGRDPQDAVAKEEDVAI